jgi:AraC family transcriptional regulator, dual regulator of chb operon
MSRPTLHLKDFVKRGESHHFARLELGPARPADLHRHDFVELFWIDKGRGVHVFDEKQFHLEAGTVIFVRPEETHTVGAADPGGRILLCNLAFRTDFWRELRQRHPKTMSDWFRKKPLPLLQRQSGLQLSDFLLRAGLELAAGARSPLMLERFLLNLTFMLQPETTGPQPPAWLLEAAGKVEQEKLFRNEGGTVLAKVSGRSAAHVAREVRRHFNKTPTDWVNAMRMRYAAKLLSETSREILDICADCGFENVGHFYALFRLYHGVTPLVYRLRSRKIVRLSV